MPNSTGVNILFIPNRLQVMKRSSSKTLMVTDQIDVGALTEIKTDTTGDQIQVSSSGTVHIWDGSDTATIVDVTDENGGTPSMVVADDWGEFGSFNVAPYAVVKIDGGASSLIITSLPSRFTRFIPTPVKPTS